MLNGFLYVYGKISGNFEKKRAAGLGRQVRRRKPVYKGGDQQR